MKPSPPIQRSVPALAFCLVALLANVHGASFSASSSPPAIDGEDIASYEPATGDDKWWVDEVTKFGNPGMTVGQTFTTGSGSVLLKAVTFRIRSATQPSKDYTIRVGEIAGTDFIEIARESSTQSVVTDADDYWTWTFDTPVVLSPGTYYGVDVGLRSSTSSWETGIPYVYVTSPGSYARGSRFRSGTEGFGVGNGTIEKISGDRAFHFDLDRPIGDTLGFFAGFPVDDATGVLLPSELVATFTQDLAEGEGDVIIRNLTDGSEVRVPIDDPRVTIIDNLLRLRASDLIEWNQSYAIRIEPGALTNAAGEPFGGIADDTTWNFSTAPADPLLEAIAGLASYTSYRLPNVADEIAQHLRTIRAQRHRLRESETILDAVFGLVASYEGSRMRPLFILAAPSANSIAIPPTPLTPAGPVTRTSTGRSTT